MAKIKVYNLEGKEIETLELSDAVFGVESKADVLHQVMVGYLANRRGPYAHTKTRGEVRGGGKKPWKQKGTGRARAGSSRSPIWVGGGITFGPRNERNYQIKINKKIKTAAMRMALSDKVKNGALIAVEKLDIGEPKTKIILGAVKNLFSKIGKEFKGRGIVISDKNNNVKRAAGNLKEFKNISSMDLNIIDVMNSDYLVLEKSALQALESRLNK